MERLEDQLGWYDRTSSRSQKRFKMLKIITLVLAGLVPVSAALDMPSAVAAVLGFGILVAEGLLQINQYEQHWLMYRGTAESLKHEKYLYLAKAGSYADAADPQRMLAEKVEALVAQEHARWVETRAETGKGSAGGEAGARAD